MVSDVYVAVTYVRSGLYVFGALLVAISLGSGVVGFALHRASWRQATSAENTTYWAQGLDASGERRPGGWELLLYVLQVQPLRVAYACFRDGRESEELVREKTLAALSEALPSALLQAYALAVEGAPQPGSVAVLVFSLAISLASMAHAANIGYQRLCANTEPLGKPTIGCQKLFMSMPAERGVREVAGTFLHSIVISIEALAALQILCTFLHSFV